MEASTATVGAPRSSGLDRARAWANANPAKVFLMVMGLVALYLLADSGLQALSQRTINGLVAGSYFALGAIGLTLVYGILQLTNFAHGDLLTLGAYVAYIFNVSNGMPFVVAMAISIVLVALFAIVTELVMFKPMRKKRAGILQLILMTIGLAFVIRYMIQLFAGTEQRKLDVNVTDTINFIGLSIGRTQLIVVIVGLVVLTAIAMMLRYTSLGRQMRALADNFDLAETTGIDTGRIVIYTWMLSGALAGLAGVMVAASIGSFTPNTGFTILLSLFAAVTLGGIGNAFGALAGGMVIGITQEWSTLVIDAEWKVAISFLVLIIVLVVRPQGIFGRERTL
jgi:neutral amino acid transport system permease protein